MPFDGSVVKAVVNELNNKILNGKIDKVYQPEKDEIILVIRSYKETNKLLISASSNHPRINLSSESRSNPQVPPSFCMLLRKHLSGARITSITQPSLERIVQINFECIDELGYSNQKSLIVEVMGRNSNIIFIDTNSNKIIDSIKHIDEEISSVREVLPSVTYVYPPSEGKLDTLSVDEEVFFNSLDLLKASTTIEKFFIRTFFGISPALAREICYEAELDSDADAKSLSSFEKHKLYGSFQGLIANLKANHYSPSVYYSDKKIVDFTCLALNIYDNYEKVNLKNISEAIELYFNERDRKDRIRQKSGDIRKIISNKLDRCNKKLEILFNELDQSQNAEKYRIYGDLLTSNLHLIKQGDKEVEVVNYYSEDQSTIKIPLDVQLTPSQNAQRYYKLYNKAKNAAIMLEKQIEENNQEIEYLESQLDNLEKCTEEIEINEIRDELAEQGYIKRHKQNKHKIKNQSKPLCFISSTGFEIYVGKNNYQNDFLTLKFASYNDIWLHTKDIPGSHVIIKTNGMEVDNTTLEEAANLASYFSKGKMSSKVPVDYTFKKYVKKPSGAKPGRVIYENQKTVYITPDEDRVNKMKAQ